jgi:hypothetical protein
MKIMTRKEFFELPAGTLFMGQSYENYNSILVKGETKYKDGKPVSFKYKTLAGELVDNENEFPSLSDLQDKDGNVVVDYDFWYTSFLDFTSELIGVYTQKEVDKLIETLKNCKGYVH